MTAPSSEQEAKEIAAEVQARPRLQAVTQRMFEVIENPDTPKKQRESLEQLVAVLDVGLFGDLPQEEHDQWMRLLDGGAPVPA